MRQLISALALRVEQCREGMNGKEISRALFGMLSLGDSPELRQLMAALIAKIQHSRTERNAQHVDAVLEWLARFCASREEQQSLKSFASSSALLALHEMRGAKPSPASRMLLRMLLYCPSTTKGRIN